eukprot:3316213-Prymnesium_polylepis.1
MPGRVPQCGSHRPRARRGWSLVLGGGVDFEKAIDPLTPSELKVGLLALDHDAHTVESICVTFSARSCC